MRLVIVTPDGRREMQTPQIRAAETIWNSFIRAHAIHGPTTLEDLAELGAWTEYMMDRNAGLAFDAGEGRATLTSRDAFGKWTTKEGKVTKVEREWVKEWKDPNSPNAYNATLSVCPDGTYPRIELRVPWRSLTLDFATMEQAGLVWDSFLAAYGVNPNPETTGIWSLFTKDPEALSLVIYPDGRADTEVRSLSCPPVKFRKAQIVIRGKFHAHGRARNSDNRPRAWTSPKRVNGAQGHYSIWCRPNTADGTITMRVIAPHSSVSLFPQTKEQADLIWASFKGAYSDTVLDLADQAAWETFLKRPDMALAIYPNLDVKVVPRIPGGPLVEFPAMPRRPEPYRRERTRL